MLSIDELRIFIKKRVAWPAKAHAVNFYHSNQKRIDKNWSLERTAYELNTTEGEIYKLVRLARFVERCPKLADIESVKQAMSLIDLYHNDEIELRFQVNKVSARDYRANKIQRKIKSKAKIKVKENESKVQYQSKVGSND